MNDRPDSAETSRSRVLARLLRRHYGGKLLPPRSLARLVTTEAVARSLPNPALGKVVAVMAVSSMVLASLLAVRSQLGSPNEGKDVAGEVAREAAAQHLASRQLEVVTEDFPRLGTALEILDFTPVIPARLRGRPLRLQGARMAVLLGEPAAEIRLESPEGSLLTLFEARQVGDLGWVRETRRQVAGVRVELWPDAGLVFVLVDPKASSRVAIPSTEHGN